MNPKWLHLSAFLLPLIWLPACNSQSAAVGEANGTEANTVEMGEAAPAVTTFQYEGLCEASAAVVLDASHFAVASDDSETIAIYRRGQARPITTVPHDEVTDLEGAARIGNTIFWLTSHSLNKEGVDKPKRKVLFATGLAPGPTLITSGSDFRDLRERAAAQLGIGEDMLRPWWNIEGLAATPEAGLLIGLRRGPTDDARALVLGIDAPFEMVGVPRPQDVVARTAPARVWRLDLGGRGIRSMERVGEGPRAYLIVAGPREEEAGTFALFWWDGTGEAVTPGPAVSFGDMTPEALIAWGDGEIQILGDNEGEGPNRCSEDPDDPRPRRFPSLSVRL